MMAEDLQTALTKELYGALGGTDVTSASVTALCKLLCALAASHLSSHTERKEVRG